MTALQFAVDINQEKIINLFLSAFRLKFDINAKSIEAVIRNEIEIFERTPLYMSIEKKNINLIKLLLKSEDINVNEKSYHFSNNSQIHAKTALHLAAEIGDLEIIKLLLEKKEIDINIEDSQGKKPIDYSNNIEIKQLLLK